MSSSASPPRRSVAAFDLDGTLTRRDCVTPFLRRATGIRLLGALLRRAPAVVAALVRRDRDRLKELATTALRGCEAHALATLGETFATEVHAGWLRPDTCARLDWHRAQGHATVIVSASFEPYAAPLGRLLGVDEVLCTRLEVGPDGRLTGRLDGPNCRGPEKAARLDHWLRAHGLEGGELWAYGDSGGDDALLAAAAHPHRVDGIVVAERPTIEADLGPASRTLTG